MKNKQKILIVDNDIDTLRKMELMLTEESFEVISTSNDSEVSELITEHRPDLIILDIFLKGFDGRDLCHQLKNNEMSKFIPILLISDKRQLREKLKECSADGFLRKPFEKSDLLYGIENCLLLQ